MMSPVNITDVVAKKLEDEIVVMLSRLATSRTHADTAYVRDYLRRLALTPQGLFYLHLGLTSGVFDSSLRATFSKGSLSSDAGGTYVHR